MSTDARIALTEALHSERFARRIQKARRFERIEGGGTLKKLERLTQVPSIYIPYLLNAKAGLSRIFLTSVTLFWGRTIRMPLDDYDALILYMYGGLYGGELKLTKFLIQNLKPSDVFYDIGANRGFYTFLGIELCQEVHVFEPMRALAELIKNNVRKGDSVTVNAIALSDQNGSIDFYVTPSTMTSTINAEVAARHSSVTVTVPTITLDTYVSGHPRPTLLKIDAEGAEDQILAGGSRFFSEHTPVITMEIWGKDNNWELSMRAAERLRSMGYRSFRIGDDGSLTEVTGDLSALAPPRGSDNFVFKK